MTGLVKFSILSSIAAGAPLLGLAVLAALAHRRRPQALADDGFRWWTVVVAWGTAMAVPGLIATYRLFGEGAYSLAMGVGGLLLLFSYPAAEALRRATIQPEPPESPVRTASLGPRRLRRYLSLRALAVPYLAVAAGLGFTGWRGITGESQGGQRSGLGFAYVAVVMLFCFAELLRRTARLPQSLSPTTSEAGLERIRRVQLVTIHRWQTVTAGGLSVLAVATATLDWARPPQAAAGTVIAALAVLLAVAAAARAIGSNLDAKRLR